MSAVTVPHPDLDASTTNPQSRTPKSKARKSDAGLLPQQSIGAPSLDEFEWQSPANAARPKDRHLTKPTGSVQRECGDQQHEMSRGVHTIQHEVSRIQLSATVMYDSSIHAQVHQENDGHLKTLLLMFFELGSCLPRQICTDSVLVTC